MSNHRFTRLGLVAAAIVATSFATAQTTTTGALAGTVRDKAGNPVAGAAVRMSSGQITRTVLTNADGKYRVPLLNPGTYHITVTKPGLVTFNQNTLVTLNETTTFNIRMAGEGGAVVEVVGAVVGVDQTTAQTGANYTMDTLTALPLGRSMNDIMMLTPGVQDGAIGLGPSMSGASGAENSYVLDGLTTTDTRYGSTGNSLVTDFIDQAEVQTGAFKPEYSALGGVFNVVTKSGSNTFKGSSWLTYDVVNWQAGTKYNKYYDAYKQSSPYDRFDVGAEVSGPLIKDKLFYMVGVDADLRTVKTEANNNGFQGDDDDQKRMQFVTKLNYFVNQDMQLTFFANYNPSKYSADTLYPAAYGSANYGREFKGETRGLNLSFDWTITPALLFSAKIGQNFIKEETTPTATGSPLIADRLWFRTQSDIPLAGGGTGTGTQPDAGLYGNATSYFRSGYGSYSTEEGTNTQFRADLSYSFNLLGSHQVKGGISRMESKYSELTRFTGTVDAAHPTDPRYTTTYGYTVGRSGTYGGFYVRVQDYSQDAEVKTIFDAFYLQDQWEVIPGLKFVYGARFEKQDLKDWRGDTFMKFGFGDAVSPRVGMIWDVNNDGKSKISINYAKYYEQMPQRLSMRQQGREVFTRTWYGLTGYRTSGLPDFDTSDIRAFEDYAAPFSDVPIQKGLKLPKRVEYVIGYDRTIDGWTVGIHGKYRKLTDPIEDITPWIYDPNDADGSTPDDGFAGGRPVDFGMAYPSTSPYYGYYYGQAILANPKPGTIRWKPKSYSGSIGEVDAQGYLNWNSWYPEAYNIYRAVDLTVERQTERYYVNASITWSRMEGTYEGLVSSSNGQTDANITASWDYPMYVGSGLLPLDRTMQVKLVGSYNWNLGPGKLTAGFNFSLASGTPISKWGNGEADHWIDVGSYGDSIPLNNKLGQMGRTPSTSNTDFHVDYAFKLGKVQMVPSLDVFNLFNQRMATAVDEFETDSNGIVTNRWGLENAWQVGRRFRVGLKVRF